MKVLEGQIWKVHLPFKDEIYTQRIVTVFTIEVKEKFVKLFSIKNGEGRFFEMGIHGFKKVSELIG